MSTPLILDGKFFEIVKVSEDGKRVAAKCKSCIKDTVILGSVSATSNFLTHLKRVHKDECESYEEYKRSRSRSSEDYRFRRRRDSFPYPICPAGSSTPDSTPSASPPQDVLDYLIFKFIVNGARPLSTVEDDDFRNLITALRPGAQVMDKKELKYRILMENELYRQKISTELLSTSYVCLTADVWSASGKTYLGINAHWINDNLERRSGLLLCRPYSDPGSRDQIVDLFLECYKSFQFIHDRILNIVTDNNEQAAVLFQPYDAKSYDLSTVNGDGDGYSSDDEDTLSDGFQFLSLSSLLQKARVEQILPKIGKCLPHALTSSVIRASINMEESGTKCLLLTSMGKCSALWNACCKTKQSEVVRDVTGKTFKTTEGRKWNVVYDFVAWVLEPDVRAKLDVLCQALNLIRFTAEEVCFLETLDSLLKPISHGLELLQGGNSNSDVFLGSLLPCLLSIQTRLSGVAEQAHNVVHSKLLAGSLLEEIHRSFGHILSFQNADTVFAAISHPYFKLRWIPPEKYVELRQWFLDEAQKRGSEDQLTDIVPAEDVDADNDFYNFPSEKHLKTEPGWTTNKARLECLQYFEDSSTRLEMLHKYPLVKGLFVQYNTPLTSSAPVEKLLDFTGLIASHKRNRLSDKHFEAFMFLKCNRD